MDLAAHGRDDCRAVLILAGRPAATSRPWLLRWEHRALVLRAKVALRALQSPDAADTASRKQTRTPTGSNDAARTGPPAAGRHRGTSGPTRPGWRAASPTGSARAGGARGKPNAGGSRAAAAAVDRTRRDHGLYARRQRAHLPPRRVRIALPWRAANTRGGRCRQPAPAPGRAQFKPGGRGVRRDRIIKIARRRWRCASGFAGGPQPGPPPKPRSHCSSPSARYWGAFTDVEHEAVIAVGLPAVRRPWPPHCG
jgi:hypothetical protein